MWVAQTELGFFLNLPRPVTFRSNIGLVSKTTEMEVCPNLGLTQLGAECAPRFNVVFSSTPPARNGEGPSIETFQRPDHRQCYSIGQSCGERESGISNFACAPSATSAETVLPARRQSCRPSLPSVGRCERSAALVRHQESKSVE